MIYKDDRFKILHQGIDTLVIGVNCTDEKYFDTKFSAFIHKIAMLKQQAQKLEFTPLEFETVPNRANRY